MYFYTFYSIQARFHPDLFNLVAMKSSGISLFNATRIGNVITMITE